MSIASHLESLTEKHAAIESKIALEMSRPMPDFALITQMKKQKLSLKEEIERYQSLSPQEAKNAS